MKIAIKSGDVEISVEYEVEPPRPNQSWYGLNMISFTESIQKCITKSAEEILKIQNKRHTPSDDGGKG